MLTHKLLPLRLQLILLSFNYLLLQQILFSLLFKHYFSPFRQLFSLPLQPILLRLLLYRLFYLQLSKPSLMFDLFFQVLLLQQRLLLLDKFFVSHRFHLKLLVYDESISGIG
jgi:hypothetical protein